MITRHDAAAITPLPMPCRYITTRCLLLPDDYDNMPPPRMPMPPDAAGQVF